MQQPETHLSLIVRLQGSLHAPGWREFVEAYEPFLKNLVERQGVSQGDVADVTQQVLLGIARSVEQWQSDGNPASFRRWLNRVARNAAIKFLTSERRQIRGQGGTDFLERLEQAPAEPSVAQAAEYESELIRWAAGEVRGEFRETSWKAFWGTQVEGRPVPEVAAELGVSVGSIYMSRSRIMARIRVKVAEVLE
jgi:RNA polymerase sigma factor (sigma-70 family)